MEKHEHDKFWSDFRVGLITLIALIGLILGITFAGGDKGLLFKKTSVVKAHLTNVGGLKRGCSVTMSGMTIGRVSNIAFIGESNTSQIEVTTEIQSELRNKIKVDSVPSIRTQGMMGDRYLDISMGSPEAQVLPPFQFLVGKAATDFDETLHKAVDVMTQTEKLMSEINEGKGTVGKLIYDGNFYSQLMNTLSELENLLKDFRAHPKKFIKLSVF